MEDMAQGYQEPPLKLALHEVIGYIDQSAQ
jgi:hypothetical protein